MVDKKSIEVIMGLDRKKKMEKIMNMKKAGFMICLILLTCSLVNVSARTLRVDDLYIDSGNATTFGSGGKTTSIGKTETLMTVKEGTTADLLMYYTYTKVTLKLLAPVMFCREGSQCAINYYSDQPSNVSLGVKILIKSDTFSWTSFPVSGWVEIY